MLNISSLRYRYTQFFVLFMLCSLTYMMVWGIRAGGVTNFQDNLYQKFFLIEVANSLRIKIGDRVFPVALIGKDGWIHYTGDGELNYFQNTRGLEEKGVVQKLTTLNQYLKSQGITLLIVAAPNKSTIYPETLPQPLDSLSTQSWLDSLISELRDNNLPVILDLRPTLRTARQEHDVFYKTDTHWNGYGAFAAYTTIINTLGNLYPDLTPYKATDLNLITAGPDIRDIPKLMGVNTITEPSFFFAPKEPFVQTLILNDRYDYNQFSWISNSKLPTLLMFHDSQGAMYLNNYLSMNFGKSNFIHLLGITKYLTRESIQYFKPDVIIIEIVERGLQALPDYLGRWESP